MTDISVTYDLGNKRRKSNLVATYNQKQFLKLNLGTVRRFPFPLSYKHKKHRKKIREIKEGQA